MKRYPPERIVCLTEETVETLYLLGEQERIVGVTGFAVRPPEVRREKPRVGAFTSADVPGIKALAPDLVLTFSDLQAPIADALIREGIAVHAFNQRSIAGTLGLNLVANGRFQNSCIREPGRTGDLRHGPRHRSTHRTRAGAAHAPEVQQRRQAALIGRL